MATIKYQTVEELRNKIANFKGFSWGSMKTRTKFGTNKKSRLDKTPTDVMFGPSGITAFGTKYCGIGYDYRTSVNNKREKVNYVSSDEGWEPHSLPFGEWWNGSKVIIKHTLKNDTEPTYYLRVTYNSALSKKNTSELKINEGLNSLNEEQHKRLHEFITPKPPAKPAGENSQGLEEEDKIEVRTFKLENILELTFGGNTYIKE